MRENGTGGHIAQGPLEQPRQPCVCIAVYTRGARSQLTTFQGRLRAVPYLGNVVGLYLCTEALSGYRMTPVAAEPQARLREVGEIRYEDPVPTEGRPASPQIAGPEPRADAWVALRSNGVLEDRFFATLLRGLGEYASTPPARSSDDSPASPH